MGNSLACLDGVRTLVTRRGWVCRARAGEDVTGHGTKEGATGPTPTWLQGEGVSYDQVGGDRSVNSLCASGASHAITLSRR